VETGTRGTAYFDDFESSRFSYIGTLTDPGVIDPQATNLAGWFTRTYQYSATIPHAVTGATPETGSPDTYTYDANGNMTCRVEGGVTFKQTYNAENRISTIQKLASGTCASPGNLTAHWAFAYDGDGTRVSTLYTPYVSGAPQTSVLTAYYMGGAYELTGSAVKKYYSVAGMMVAVNDGTGLQYLLTDHLGSTVAVTNSSGTLTSQQRYLPFGAVRSIPNSPILATDFGYTGQRKLDDGMGGIMDYKARFYSPALSRFLQPDSIIPNPANPQAYNRFSYVYNRPVNFNDPSGHDADYFCSSSSDYSSRCTGYVQDQANLGSGGSGNDGGNGGGGSEVPLSTRGQQLIDFAESLNMTPEEVIGIGLGHEMFGDNEEEQKIHMDVFRNGFLGYANERCNGNPTYNCMLNYFSSAYESVYNQFLENGVPATLWEDRDDYIFKQEGGNLGPGNKAKVQLGKEFMLGFMSTISSYSFDPNLASNSGVVDALTLNKALGGIPTYEMGFLVVKSVTCPNTGAAGYTLYYNLWGQQKLDAAGLGVC